MTPRGLILALKSPFSGPPTTGPRASALPPDLLREARRRLGILARLLIALAIVNVVLGHTLFPRLQVAWPVVADVIVASVTCVSLGVFLYTRRAMTDPESFVTLGLVYEVVVAAGVAAVEHVSLTESGMTGGPIISRLGMIILMFAAIVPSTPRRTLLTASIAASMDPLAMATAIAARHLSVAPAHLLWMHIPDVLAVAIATLISGVITRLGREVRDARELGSYRLGALLGRGGMGEVYVAHHRMLARPAAIKLIRPEKAAFDGTEHAQRVAQRFRREAEAAAGLRSPHTIELYDFGKTDDGTLYFVMELLDGIDLDSLVERFGPIPPARTVHVLQQVCASLAEAHAQGLVHRDIKPANIHLCRMGLEHDFVKVLDFGIVKSRQPVTEGPQLATAARHARVHAARDGDGRRRRRPRRSVRRRLPGVLASDGPPRVQRGHCQRDHRAAHPRRTGAALHSQPVPGRRVARRRDSGVPGEGRRAAAARCTRRSTALGGV